MAGTKKTIKIPTLDELDQFKQAEVLTPIFKKQQKPPETTESKISQNQSGSNQTSTCVITKPKVLSDQPNVSQMVKHKQQSTESAKFTDESKINVGATVVHKSPNNTTHRKMVEESNVTESVQSENIQSTTGCVDGSKAVEESTATADIPVVKPPKSSNSILVSSKQQGNPILKHVRNVPWEFSSIVPDYELGLGVCALFLSVRYHQQNPDYIHGRLKELGKAYNVRIILMLVDSKEPHMAVKELARICILADCTLILAFSCEEAGRYLETYKVYENKPPDVLMEKSDDNYMARFSDCLTTVKSVNKTDCSTLLSTFGSFEKISQASADDLSLCPGVGPQKASRLHGVLHEPFLKSRKETDKDKTC